MRDIEEDIREQQNILYSEIGWINTDNYVSYPKYYTNSLQFQLKFW